ncbi:MAG: hypothetical protein HFJ20_07660 [Clostridia bacterium]|nr:hypothetical protein [Clostridia bacterium]
MAVMTKARREGIEKRIEEGKKDGIRLEKVMTAKKMLAKKIDINLIIEITGLTKEEIENL